MTKHLTALSIFLALCFSAGGRGENTPFPADDTEGNELVVMSYNMRYAKAKDGNNAWKKRRKATAEMLGKISPDVFGVQEAYPEQEKYITRKCPRYKAFGVGREDGNLEGERMSVFYDSRILRMIKGGTFWLSETPEVPSKGWDAACRRTATWVLLEDKRTGRLFYFVNTHLDHIGKTARRKGLEMIVERIALMNREGYPMVLTGDFNVRPDDPGLSELNEKMESARSAAILSDYRGSYNGFGRVTPSIIDYIYFDGFQKCVTFKVVTDRFLNIPYISDHYPIVSTLKF